MNNFLDAALRNEKQIIADRRHIHKNPEVGFICLIPPIM